MFDPLIYTTPTWKSAKEDPSFSIVIPCYNHAESLPQAVQSIVDQTHPDWELLMVNDGSSDQSESVAQSLLEQYSHLRLALLSQAPSGHPAHARNTGIAQARADWILCLDADDQINPTFLAAAQTLIQAKPWIGLAYPIVASLNDPQFEPVQHPFEVQKILEWVLIPTATVFRKAAWEATGGYAATGYEDWDFWLGCLEQGYFPQPMSEAVFYYRSSLSGVYGKHLGQDGRYKAQIIARHPALFSTLQRYWAQKVLANPSDLALQKAFRAGTMPQFSGDTPSACAEWLEQQLSRLNTQSGGVLSAKEHFELLLTRLPFSETHLESQPFSIQAQVQIGPETHRLKLPLPGPFQADLPTEIATCLLAYPQRLLLLGNPQDPRWEPTLEICLRSPQTELLFALWLPPEQTPEQTPEEWLLDWLDRHALDPENIPELVLLPAIPTEHCPVAFAFFEQIYLAPGSVEGLAEQILLSGKTLWSAESFSDAEICGVQAIAPTNPWFERLQASEPDLRALTATTDFRQRWNQACLQNAGSWFDRLISAPL